MKHHIRMLTAPLYVVLGLAACQQPDALSTGPKRVFTPAANVVVTPNPLVATQRVGFGLPAGQVAAPNTPGGAVVVGAFLYTGDGANGVSVFNGGICNASASTG